MSIENAHGSWPLLALNGPTPLQRQLLPMMPLVAVAWLEGGVTVRERRRIMDLAAYRGIRPGTSAAMLLDDWLTERPTPEFVERTIAVLRNLIGRMPAEERAIFRHDLLLFAEGIARASGWNGRGEISLAERALLDRFTAALADPASEVADTVPRRSDASASQGAASSASG